MPRATDGESLAMQPPEVRTLFSAVWGAAADGRWIDERNAALARGRSGRVPRIGLYSRGAVGDTPNPELFVQALRELGYEPGRTVDLEYRFADNQTDLYPRLLDDLVKLPVDVIVGVTGNQGSLDAKQATSTIPIVLISGGDPVGAGLLTNAERPEGNLTGFNLAAPDTWAKRLQLVKELKPGATRVGFMWNPDNPANPGIYREVQEAAPALGLQVDSLEVRAAADLERAFAAAASTSVDAILPTPAVGGVGFIGPIVELARQHRIPVVGSGEAGVDAGMLIALAPNPAELPNRAAGYVDRLLKGARVADLPLGYPARFDVHINLQTARDIGLTIPEPVLARAPDSAGLSRSQMVCSRAGGAHV